MSGLIGWGIIEILVVALADGLVDLVGCGDDPWAVLAAGGEDSFNFFGRAHTQLSNVNYSRMDTNTQVAYFCAGATTACFYVTSRIGGQINRSVIVYGRKVCGDPNDWFQHGLAHEFGHGFALLHHLPNCGFVMSRDNCPDLAVAADIGTALEDVLGY